MLWCSGSATNRRRMGRGRGYLGAVLLLVALHASAQAAGEKEAETQARAQFAAGHYQEAIEIYARLYAETLHPTYLRNVARCYQNMGDADRAITSFHEYLRKAKQLSREDRAVIEGYIAEMEQLKRSRASAAATPAAPTPAPRPAPPAPTPSATRALAAAPRPAASSPALVQSPAIVSKTAPAAEPGPFYTRWWFWATVGAVAAAGVTSFVVLSADRSPSHGDLGALDLTGKRP